MNHPLSGKRRSEVTVDEILSLAPIDYVCYTNWLVQIKLDYLIAEGFINVQFDNEGTPIFHCLMDDGSYAVYTETQLEDSILRTTLTGIGRYI